jgi:hypothetical protein
MSGAKPFRRLVDGSRMSREAHVRFWEGAGVQLPRATRLLVLSERHLRRILTRCRVEGWCGTPCARLQPPPDRTARTVFPYAALLPASRQGL